MIKYFYEFLIKNHILIKQIIVYGIIGAVASIIDSLLFYFLGKYLNIYISNFICVNIGITISFLLNTFINFKKKDNLIIRGVYFFLIGYVGLLLSMLILYIGTHCLKIDRMFVKIFSIFLVASIQFILNKTITYRRMGYNG